MQDIFVKYFPRTRVFRETMTNSDSTVLIGIVLIHQLAMGFAHFFRKGKAMVCQKLGSALERQQNHLNTKQQTSTGDQLSKSDRFAQTADRLLSGALSGDSQTFLEQHRFRHGE